jgi:hypothetical protein
LDGWATLDLEEESDQKKKEEAAKEEQLRLQEELEKALLEQQ